MGKPGHSPTHLPTVPQQRILVACHNLVLTGGLLRFERVGSILRDWGHEVAFVVLAEDPGPAEMETSLPALSFDQAAAVRWDAVMVPGAGFPEQTIEKLRVFKREKFGVRVQHILNDRSRAHWFKEVNQSFAPHIVIFNNLDWPAGSFMDLEADRFHVLLGAVDLQGFRPRAQRSHPLSEGKWIVGGLAAKNPGPLVEALAELPHEVCLRLFGPDSHGLSTIHRHLIESGRLELTGALHGEDLQNFYREVDCVVMTETFAGWANLVAESMASGVPAICTRHGTAPFAHHEQTALVLEEPNPKAIATAIGRLMNDAALCQRLTERARETISMFAWDNYARQMLGLILPDSDRHTGDQALRKVII